MREQDILWSLDKAVGQARFGAYALLDVNEDFAERLEERLRELSKMIQARRKAVERLGEQMQEARARLSA